MDRVKVRSSGQDHDVDVTVQQFLVGVETREQVIVGHLHLVGICFLETLAGRHQAVLKQIGHGDQLDVLAGIHGVDCCAAATTTAANQPDSKAVRTCCVGGAGQGQGHGQCGASRQRCLEKRATCGHDKVLPVRIVGDVNGRHQWICGATFPYSQGPPKAACGGRVGIVPGTILLARPNAASTICWPAVMSRLV